MKSKKRRSYSWIVIILSIGMIGSSLTPAATGFAEALASGFEDFFGSKPLGESDKVVQEVPNQELTTDASQNQHLQAGSNVHVGEETVFVNQEIEPKLNSGLSKAQASAMEVKPKDLFELTQDQMERLLLAGYAVEDLYKTDELANRLLIEPERLVERLLESRTEWAELERELEIEQRQNALERLSIKHAAAYRLLQDKGLSESEQVMLLTMVDLGKGNVNELMSVYQLKGEKGLAAYQASQSTVQGKSTLKMSSSINPAVLERLRQASEKSGVPLEELVSNYEEAVRISKQALAERKPE